MPIPLKWVPVAGGSCRFGDCGRRIEIPSLLWTQTPVTLGQLGLSTTMASQDEPITQVSMAEAANYALQLGGRLPGSAEWEWMAAGLERRLFPWGMDEWTGDKAALALVTLAKCPVGRFPAGTTPDGLHDVAGNVWEWTATTLANSGAYIRGGSYVSQPVYARTTFKNAAPVELRSSGLGFRAVRLP
jgi:formylglycine-generating enzyme